MLDTVLVLLIQMTHVTLIIDPGPPLHPLPHLLTCPGIHQLKAGT